MKASVIVCTINRCNFLEDCLNSLLRQTFQDFETIVVDGGSTDGTRGLIKRYAVRFIVQNRKYLPNAINCGIRAARGEILAFIDDDAVASPTWIEEIVKTYDQFNGEVGGVGGRILSIGALSTPKSNRGKPPGLWTNLLRRVSNVVVRDSQYQSVGVVCRSGELIGNFDRKLTTVIKVEHIQGCNMSFRSQIIKKVGLFDEAYAFTSFRNESDFCLRVRKAGYRLLYNSNAVVFHQGLSPHISQPIGQNIRKKHSYNAKNDIYFVLKNRKIIPNFALLRFFVKIFLSVEQSLRFALRRRDLSYLSIITGILEGLRHKPA